MSSPFHSEVSAVRPENVPGLSKVIELEEMSLCSGEYEKLNKLHSFHSSHKYYISLGNISRECISIVTNHITSAILQDKKTDNNTSGFITDYLYTHRTCRLLKAI